MAPWARTVVGWLVTQLRAVASASLRARRTAAPVVALSSNARPSSVSVAANESGATSA